MPRSARLDVPGTLHHVIGRGIERRQIVGDNEDRTEFVERFNRIAIETETPIYAWALMSNHFHFLLHSGPEGLSSFMRKFLTSYALYYNRKRKRHGHVFQNRYKSILCEEDSYLYELVRYIHLNPLRAKLVKSLAGLDTYPWSGHSTLLGNQVLDSQHTPYILGYFDKRLPGSRKAYRDFVKEGISKGKCSELVGGGLVRSLGGWSEVVSMRKENDRVAYDARILGSSEFVEMILKQGDKSWQRRLRASLNAEQGENTVAKHCEKYGINVSELQGGSRRKPVSAVRKHLAEELVLKGSMSLASAGRLLGVSTSGVSAILRKLS